MSVAAMLREYGLLGCMDSLANMNGEQLAVINALVPSIPEEGEEEEEDGDEPCLEARGVTFFELQQNSVFLSNQLYMRLGVRPGDKVLLAGYGSTSAELTAMLACMRLQAVFVPVSVQFQSSSPSELTPAVASLLATIIADGTPQERDHYGGIYAHFLFSGPARTGLLHADPHPGNFRVIPDEDGSPGRMGVLDYGSVARLPQRGLPQPMGRLITLCAAGDGAALVEGLREEGFLKDRIRLDPQLLMDYLSPFVEPTQVERFRFSREWMREQFQRINNPKDPAYTVSIKLNLPPSYVLIHRTWLGGVGVLSQLEAEAPFRALLEEYLPGFTPAG